MSSNPQWKMFQPPDSHSSSLHDILDIQQSNMQAKQVFRNGKFNNTISFIKNFTQNILNHL